MEDATSVQVAGAPEKVEQPANGGTSAKGAQSVRDLGEVIAQAEALLQLAERRRTQRRRLRELLGQLEQHVRQAIQEEDQEAASWLRNEINRMEEAASQAPAPKGRPEQPTARPPAVVEPIKPPPTPRAAPVAAATPPALTVFAYDPPVSKAAADLRHWQDRWNELVQWALDGTCPATAPAWILRARAVFLGVHSFILRNKPDKAEGSAVAYAQKLAAAIREQLTGSGDGPEQRLKGSSAAGMEAHMLRDLSDGYFRAAIAQQLLANELESPSPDPQFRAYCVGCALASLQYHQKRLAKAGFLDDLVYAAIQKAAELAAEVGAEGLSPEAELSSQPPYKTKELSALLPKLAEKPQAAPEESETVPWEELIRRVTELVTSRPDFGADRGRLDEDREAVVPLLRAAFDAGIPQSNKELRDVILERWHDVLEGVEGFEVFLREVAAEIERRESEAEAAERAEPDAEPGGANGECVQRLRPLLEGKRILLLGGTPRVHTAPKLKDALGCAEVLWPEAKRTDDAGKFEADMRRADVIIVIKNFARHAAANLASRVTDETGGHLIVLPAGYGVNKILAEMDEYFQQRGHLPAS